ncbi:MAG: hypothetical protein QOF58_4003 [Pseudonocardiales bacterium]|nr:hypothetical protein [Pseudonocardiales bacterium]
MTFTITEPRTRLVHSGIDAPYPLSITGLTALETDRGVAFHAELVHPEHGAVGRISNNGCGDDSCFHAYDDTTFSTHDLNQFLQRCLQDGVPMNPDALHVLLEELVYEAETAETVTEARTAGLFLVRSYLHRAENWGPQRGTPHRRTRIVRSRAAREQLADRLDSGPGHGVYGPSAYWQMFDGVDWTPLLGPSPLTEDQVEARIRRATRLIGGSFEREPFDEELYLYGNPAGRFALLGDTISVLNVSSWCRCARRRRRTVRFERWNNHVLQESGVVHAAKTCRRLIRID